MPCMSPRQSWLGCHLLCNHMVPKGTNGHIVWPLPCTETNRQDYSEHCAPSRWSRHLSSSLVDTGMHGWIKTFVARCRHEGSTETTLARIKHEQVFGVKKLNPTRRTTCCQDMTPCMSKQCNRTQKVRAHIIWLRLGHTDIDKLCISFPFSKSFI